MTAVVRLGGALLLAIALWRSPPYNLTRASQKEGARWLPLRLKGQLPKPRH
jgi:hypothetical protein